MRFILDCSYGCDISFVVEAPEDITLKELLDQCDKIKPDWCACGIRSCDDDFDYPTEIFIEKGSIHLANDSVPAKIIEPKGE